MYIANLSTLLNTASSAAPRPSVDFDIEVTSKSNMHGIVGIE
jgi:hypothetical protein